MFAWVPMRNGACMRRREVKRSEGDARRGEARPGDDVIDTRSGRDDSGLCQAGHSRLGSWDWIQGRNDMVIKTRREARCGRTEEASIEQYFIGRRLGFRDRSDEWDHDCRELVRALLVVDEVCAEVTGAQSVVVLSATGTDYREKRILWKRERGSIRELPDREERAIGKSGNHQEHSREQRGEERKEWESEAMFEWSGFRNPEQLAELRREPRILIGRRADQKQHQRGGAEGTWSSGHVVQFLLEYCRTREPRREPEDGEEEIWRGSEGRVLERRECKTTWKKTR
ncbi:hypothetical protein B0H16DRAFT_1475976 [Mycena metata]|uniref:Uncharacterized protein n=1 Tax=Mycena metata TaxID=1033252 RepID=A0AAD7MHF5_9AGAR|nr:hypothetical protein B0H16DRAFT_1475976 [Mycena metata]